MNLPISGLDPAEDLQDDDLLVISQKLENGQYDTRKITADKLKTSEEFWIVVHNRVIATPSDPYPAESDPLDKIIGRFIVPSDVYIEAGQRHYMYVVDNNYQQVDNILVYLTNYYDFEIRERGSYESPGRTLDPEDIELQLSSYYNNSINPFSFLEDGQRLYIRAGSIITFALDTVPQDLHVTITLVAKKADRETQYVLG